MGWYEDILDIVPVLQPPYSYEFIAGVVSLNLREGSIYDAHERKPLEDLTELEEDEIITNDLYSYLRGHMSEDIVGEEFKGVKPYDDFSAKLGLIPLSRVVFSFNQQYRSWVSKSLADLIQVNNGLISQDYITELLEKGSLLKEFPKDGEKVGKYTQVMRLSLSEIASFGLASEAGGPIWQVFDECAVLQSNHVKDKERVLYRFRMDAGLYIDSSMKHIECAGLRYLREPGLLAIEDRLSNLRNEFAEAKIAAFKDEFRLAAARLNPNFKQEDAHYWHLGYEEPNFAKYYESLSPQEKLSQDERERQALEIVKGKYSHLIFTKV
jgi:hypothetical protein